MQKPPERRVYKASDRSPGPAAQGSARTGQGNTSGPGRSTNNGQQRPAPPRRKRKKIFPLPVLLAAVLVLFIIALAVTLLTRDKGEDTASLPAVTASGSYSAPTAQGTSSGAGVQVHSETVGAGSDSQSAAISAGSLSTSSQSFAQPGLYDEPGTPLLLNRNNPLPDGYEDSVVLASVGWGNGKDQQMEQKAAAAFLAMQAAAAGEGITLSPFSCYRSHQRQTNNYNNSIQNYLNQGLGQEEAERRTQEYYAIPGTSEHEAGLAVDINGIEESFENTDAFAWLQQHCAEYGFILRYPKDKVDITQIAYEPWHYRYVGANHASAIQAAGLTLEEYVLGG